MISSSVLRLIGSSVRLPNSHADQPDWSVLQLKNRRTEQPSNGFRYHTIVFCRLLLCLLVAVLLRAEDHWTGLKYGPFEVLSSSGDKPAREALMYLEQFRDTLRIITGKEEMKMVWPVRVLVFKKAPAGSGNFALGRDARMMAIPESGAFPREPIDFTKSPSLVNFATRELS